MLVLTRKSHEQIQIGNDITVTILRVKGGAIRVGIEAPRNVNVLRKELLGKQEKETSLIEAVASGAPVAVAAPPARRRTMEGAASILPGGKSRTLDLPPGANPLRSRMTRATAPLGGYLVRQ